MQAGGDKAGEMRHIDHEVGADAVGDLAERLEVPNARIAGAARDDDLRLMLLGERLDLLHVDAVVVLAHRVGHRLEPLARQVHGRAVRQMAAGGEIEAHEGVARLSASARNTDWFACEPELGCTLAKPQPNSCFARSIARFSAMSTYWQPP